MVRPAVAAGSFYEKDKERLINQVESCFKGIEKKQEKAKAIIVPHAGYFFSGNCAAHAYAKIKGKTFVMLGPNHSGYSTGLSEETWETPLGKVDVDKALCKEIMIKSGMAVKEGCHSKEHSIEVQLPFLQHLYKKFMFVPISFGTDIEPYIIGKKLRFLLEKEAIIIVSSDFTHYGLNYGYLPFTSEVKKNLEKLDRGAIDSILKKDFNGFKKYMHDTGITICGYMGILVLLSMLEGTGYKGELIKYYTSGDVLGDYKNCVSYASIIFK